MKQRRIFALALAIFVLVGLACTRSASGPMPEVAAERQAAGMPTEVVLEQATTTGAVENPAAASPTLPLPTPTQVPPTPMPQPTATPLPQPTATSAPLPTPAPTQGAAGGSHPVPTEYVLKRGEFPYCIARRFNIHPDDLLQANGISPWQYYFQPGTRLRIPQNARPFTAFAPRALRPHPTTYTVHGSAETLYSIACLFGDVWPEDIAQANGLPLSDTPLTPGTVLQIP